MKLFERIFRNKKAYVTSKYGWRIHPITQKRNFHSGTDYGTNLQKWEQFALEEGKVVSAGIDRSLAGNNAIFAWIEYPRLELRLLHYHLDAVFVKAGQLVDRNTIIGTTGKTGNSTNIHLHLGVKKKVYRRWVYVDPEEIEYSVPTNQLVVDGIWGLKTTLALQNYFRTVPAGFISGQIRQKANQHIRTLRSGLSGSNLVRTIQKSLGIKVDGYIGRETIMKMQRTLGVNPTGYVEHDSDSMVAEMQRRLNNGKLW